MCSYKWVIPKSRSDWEGIVLDYDWKSLAPRKCKRAWKNHWEFNVLPLEFTSVNQ